MASLVLPQYAVRPPERVLFGPERIPALLVAPETFDSCPAALLQHGYGSAKEDVLPLATHLATCGFVSLLPDAWGHGERFPSSGPNWMTTMTGEYFGEVLQHTVDDMRLAIDVLVERPETRGEDCLVAGFSLGAMAALVVGMEDARTSGIICASGAPLTDMMRHPFLVTQQISEASQAYAEQHDASRLVKRYAPRPLLLQHGRSDDMVPIAGTLRLYEEAKPYYARSPKKLGLMLYEHSHYITPEQISDAVNWIMPFYAPELLHDLGDESDLRAYA